jgi:hypothetical protein
MSADTAARALVGSDQALYEPETPFLETYVQPEAADGWMARPAPPSPSFETPFAAEYYGESPQDRTGAQFLEVLHQLEDGEFEEALADLVQEAAATHSVQVRQLGEGPVQTEVGERMLGEWLAPLATAAEQMLDEVARAVELVDPGSVGEDELDRLLEVPVPGGETLEPVFEEFLGRLLDKAKKVAKGAVDLARKGVDAVSRSLPLGPVMQQLRRLVRPLLERVLRFALDKLPASVRPLARTLARRFLGTAGETETESAEQTEQGAAPDPVVLVRELDETIAGLLLASDEHELEAVVTEAETSFTAQAPASTLQELDAARARLAERLEALQPGQDPAPALEEFIPAVLAALRIGIRIIGRPNVVNFIAGYLARLIAPYVGAGPAASLAKDIVSTGLSMISLEAAEARPAELSASAVAGLVEDTVRELERLDDEALDDRVRLEAEVGSAAFRAAARTMPSTRLRPDLPAREASGIEGTWVAMPRPTAVRPAYRYRKYTKVFDVMVTPQLAAALRGFGGTPLTAVLRDRLQVTLPVRARVHLYEALPGTYLARVARLDNAPGLRVHRQLLPLTRQAAGLLLGHPGLGVDVPARFMTRPELLTPGQRVFYLEIAGAAVPVAGRRSPHRTSRVDVTFDLRPGRDETRVAIYLSEREAVRIAAELRASKTAGALNLLLATVRAGLDSIATQPGRHVRVLHESVPTQSFNAAPALLALGEAALGWLVGKLLDWLSGALSSYVSARSAEFISAAQDPARAGVTVVVTIPSSPLQTVVRRVIEGRPVALTDLPALVRGFRVIPTVRTYPGRRL